MPRVASGLLFVSFCFLSFLARHHSTQPIYQLLSPSVGNVMLCSLLVSSLTSACATTSRSTSNSLSDPLKGMGVLNALASMRTKPYLPTNHIDLLCCTTSAR